MRPAGREALRVLALLNRILFFCFDSEALYESPEFPQHSQELAALIVSKLYYHLGAFDESLSFALRAGTLFDLSERTEYVETVVCECFFS
jgi:hypothetical protein